MGEVLSSVGGLATSKSQKCLETERTSAAMARWELAGDSWRLDGQTDLKYTRVGPEEVCVSEMSQDPTPIQLSPARL